MKLLEANELEAFLTDQHPVVTGLETLFKAGDVVEVRAWNQSGDKYTGRYKYGKALGRVIEALDEEGFDCYYVLNPVGDKVELRDLDRGGRCVEEADIPWRRWFLLDFDPVREHKIATQEQFQAAYDAADRAKTWLQSMGFGTVILASSGNGCHLLVACNVANDERGKTLVRRVQRIVAEQFGNPQVEIEVFPDANRLVRAYGTVNKKGIETEVLRHRPSRIL